MADNRESPGIPMDESMQESFRVQKELYVIQQIEKQREAEDALMKQLMQEQEVINDLKRSIHEGLEQTEEARRYNQDLRERIRTQVYALHGISDDSLKGMQECRNAYYRGLSASMFLLSAALTVLCGCLHGFSSVICLLMLACTAMEGSLLAQDQQRLPVLNLLCRLINLLIFPVMLAMFTGFELGFAQYQLFLPYIVIAGIGITVIGTISYFFHNPYRQDKKKIRAARNQLKDIQKIAEKEARKSQKRRMREEQIAAKRQAREEKRKQKKILKQQKREERQARRNAGKEAVRKGSQQKLLTCRSWFHTHIPGRNQLLQTAEAESSEIPVCNDESADTSVPEEPAEPAKTS